VAGNSGGGGGGGAGNLFLVYDIAAWNTEQSTAGAAGTGVGTGLNGVAGSVGTVYKIPNR